MSEGPGTEEKIDFNGLVERWPELTRDQRRAAFFQLPRPDAEEFFLGLASDEQVEVIEELPFSEQRSWVRLLPLDDTADFIQEFPPEQRGKILGLLDKQTQREVMGLMAYAEDDAGGLMNPRYIRLRPEMTVDEAIRYLRAQARTNIETIYDSYVLDYNQHLLGAISFRELLLSAPEITIKEIMDEDVISVPENMDSEDVARIITQHNLMLVPVVDREGRMKGIVTYDDIADVIQEEATEDIHKLGGMEALDAPYLKVDILSMVKKRAGWLIVLFLGQTLTATAMSYFETEINRAVILALFIPLIISSGGNSGSQTSTLIIRSLALREIRARDWWRVLLRELGTGLCLGMILGIMGLLRIVIWQQWGSSYGEHYQLVAITVAVSLLGVVIWGTITGSMLPLLLSKLKLDPASASAPFVATLVDVTGLFFYFTAASLILKGTIL